MLENKKKDEYPKLVQYDLDKGWTIIWENGKQILLGYGYSRKIWDYDVHKYIPCHSGVQPVYPKDHPKHKSNGKETRW